MLISALRPKARGDQASECEPAVCSTALLGGAVSEPGAPVVWSTVKMHDSDDIDALGLDAIQETIGKLGDENPPEPPAKRRARGRKRKEAFIRALNREDKFEPEAFRLALVELGYRYELVLGFGMKLNASHRSEERAFLITFSAGIPVTFPDLSSSNRRSASSRQTFSASASAS